VRLIKIALCNQNSTVGAVRANTDRAVQYARQAAAEGATLACLPEQVIGGYPPGDLIQWRTFVTAQRAELNRFATETAGLSTAFCLGLTASVGGQLFNAAAVVHRGTVLGLVPKEKLPTYSVFYERRTFSRGGAGLELDADGVPLGDRIFQFDFGIVAVEVCEDGWSPDGPARRRCYSGAEVVVNLSASPYRMGIVDTRREMLATRSADNQAALIYVNAVGGQDELVFDGGGFVFQNGRLVLERERFVEGLASCVIDMDRTRLRRSENTTWRSDCEAFQHAERAVPRVRSTDATPTPAAFRYPAPDQGSFFLPPPGEPPRPVRERVLDELFEALALGLKDYYAKTGAFREVGVAVSGGRDSVLSLLIAWRAAQLLAAEPAQGRAGKGAGMPVVAFYLPSRFSRKETREAAARICQDLQVPLTVASIDDAFERELQATRQMLGGREPDALTVQNIQARLRTLRMWNWSNTAGGLFLQTGDMSEKAVGYTTIGGDLQGAFSVIANVPKTTVMALLDRLYDRWGFPGLALVKTLAPSPELGAHQEAEAELMPFPVLDACLSLYAGEKMAPDEVATALEAAFPDLPAERLRQWAFEFAERFMKAVFKWVQAPLAIHVGSLDLDRERALQLPVVEQGDWRRAQHE
jgi:NAD+ synthase (glutamine-hydrolysing)